MAVRKRGSKKGSQNSRDRVWSVCQLSSRAGDSLPTAHFEESWEGTDWEGALAVKGNDGYKYHSGHMLRSENAGSAGPIQLESCLIHEQAFPGQPTSNSQEAGDTDPAMAHPGPL